MCKISKTMSINDDWNNAYASIKKDSKDGMSKLLSIADGHIQSISNVYSNNSHDKNDMAQTIREYVIEQASDKNKKILNPEHYFNKSIFCTAKQYVAALNKYNKRNLFFSQDIEQDKESNNDEYDFPAQNITMPYEAVYLKEVLSEIDKMPKIEKRIFYGSVFGKKRSKDLAVELGITTANVDKIKERARKKLAYTCEYYA